MTRISKKAREAYAALPEDVKQKALARAKMLIKKGQGGEGFFSDFAKGFKKGFTDTTKAIVKVAAPVVKELALSALKKQVGAGNKKLPGQGLQLAQGLQLVQGKCPKKGGRAKPAHMVKGSQAAKDHMAKLRAMRKKK